MTDRLVGEGTAARDHAHPAGLMNGTGHDADLAVGAGGYQAGTVGTDEADRFVFQVTGDAHRIQHRDSLSDANDQGNLSVYRFGDGIGGKSGGHKNQGHVGLSLMNRFFHGIEDRDFFFEELSSPAWGNSGHDIRAVGPASAGVKAALTARDALH